MQLNRFGLRILLSTATLLTLTTSEGMAQDLSLFRGQTKPDCIQDGLQKKYVSQSHNFQLNLFYCGREEYTTQPPFR